MQLPYSDKLGIKYLNRLFDNTSECYKFFWFQAIITKIVEEGKEIISFEELIDEMIADAWYMVTEYHLNLGPKDNLEALVHYLQEITQMKPTEKKENILCYLKECRDKEVAKRKRKLIKNVPYRLQSPFLKKIEEREWNGSKEKLIYIINSQKSLMYYFDGFHGIETTILMQPEWIAYIYETQEIIKGWLQYNMILYLQRRNPGVPGIASKLHPPKKRELEKVKKYWNYIILLNPTKEIYTNTQLTRENISIDHFVPWSYVAHDELWNLHPTTKSINSRKSNLLPDWSDYIQKLCNIKYEAYEIAQGDEIAKKLLDDCLKENLNDLDIKEKLYIPGINRENFSKNLIEIIHPVYNAASNMGFANWEMPHQ